MWTSSGILYERFLSQASKVNSDSSHRPNWERTLPVFIPRRRSIARPPNMTVTDKKDDDGEIELGATGEPSATATHVSSMTPLDPAMVAMIENIDVFYIQQKLQWKEGK